MDGSWGAFSLLPQPLLYVRAHIWSKYSVFITHPPCCFPSLEFLCYREWGLTQIGLTKIAFSWRWVNRILLWGRRRIAYVAAKIVGQMCFILDRLRGSLQLLSVLWKTATFGEFTFSGTNKETFFTLGMQQEFPQGRIKVRDKVGSSIGSVNGSLNWLMSFF